MVNSPLALNGLENCAGFLVGTLLSLVVQGEGQAFFVSLFQPLSQRDRMVYDFNPVHHLDPMAVPLVVLAGWSWGAKRVNLPAYFPDSLTARTLVPISGAIANLLLVGILSSIRMLFPISGIETAIRFAILMALANLTVPIPPMSLGRAACSLFGASVHRQAILERVGAVVLTALVLLEQFAGWGGLQTRLVAMAEAFSHWVLRM